MFHRLPSSDIVQKANWIYITVFKSRSKKETWVKQSTGYHSKKTKITEKSLVARDSFYASEKEAVVH